MEQHASISQETIKKKEEITVAPVLGKKPHSILSGAESQAIMMPTMRASTGLRRGTIKNIDLRCNQVNLQLAKVAAAVIANRFLMEYLTMALFQQPYCVKDQIKT